MEPRISYERTPADEEAEFAAEQSALDGNWAVFIDTPTENVDAPVHEIVADADAKRFEDGHRFVEGAIRQGWPDGMIQYVLDTKFPVKHS